MGQIIVIGGGAAGMMAAISAAKAGAKVTLLEKNEKTGKKIYITGKGRCNLTNACEQEVFFQNILSNGKFLYSAFRQMDNRAVMAFFENAGCRLKVERGERVFPVSDHSSDVIAALNRQMEETHVRVCLNTCVKEILMEDYPAGCDEGKNHYRSRVKGIVLSDGRRMEADAVILATGGKSYASTGSTGDGYSFAEMAGHTVKEIGPALVPFTVRESWCMEMQGLSLKNVSILLKSDKKTIYQGFGEMLFTHFGVSGPLVLSASSYYVKKWAGTPVPLIIDLKPALTKEQLDKRILRDFEENKNRQFKNALDGLLPAKMIPIIIRLSGISPEKRVNEITRNERNTLIECLKNLTLTVTGTRGFQEAIITQGGVCVKEVNPSTMESKLVKGLFWAGEVLDLDAVTGGFNLQIAWSTGFLAGSSAAGQSLAQ
ncbi:MAG: NAD(P)/FAD-dependent oxidoreductase [Lachnospiraceae bacterium]|nr:NAD(P)/FAD-dependent oxidoreductase [Lachnospiraceae bacterium]MDE6184046.1 NAD(P)/FAD-dependent oxidoreductase [Lachnospiraceae bacterium]MDE7286838.1 NAD(P)/FAD-dependent oxidoreductase [Lachnospiraceae bacterium]